MKHTGKILWFLLCNQCFNFENSINNSRDIIIENYGNSMIKTYPTKIPLDNCQSKFTKSLSNTISFTKKKYSIFFLNIMLYIQEISGQSTIDYRPTALTNNNFNFTDYYLDWILAPHCNYQNFLINKYIIPTIRENTNNSQSSIPVDNSRFLHGFYHNQTTFIIGYVYNNTLGNKQSLFSPIFNDPYKNISFISHNFNFSQPNQTLHYNLLPHSSIYINQGLDLSQGTDNPGPFIPTRSQKDFVGKYSLPNIPFDPYVFLPNNSIPNINFLKNNHRFMNQDFKVFTLLDNVTHCYDNLFFWENTQNIHLKKLQIPSHINGDGSNDNSLYDYITRSIKTGNLLGVKGPYLKNNMTMYIGRNIDENGLIVDGSIEYFYQQPPGLNLNLFKDKQFTFQDVNHGKSILNFTCQGLLSSDNLENLEDKTSSFFACIDDNNINNTILINNHNFLYNISNSMGYLINQFDNQNIKFYDNKKTHNWFSKNILKFFDWLGISSIKKFINFNNNLDLCDCTNNVGYGNFGKENNYVTLDQCTFNNSFTNYNQCSILNSDIIDELTLQASYKDQIIIDKWKQGDDLLMILNGFDINKKQMVVCVDNVKNTTDLHREKNFFTRNPSFFSRASLTYQSKSFGGCNQNTNIFAKKNNNLFNIFAQEISTNIMENLNISKDNTQRWQTKDYEFVCTNDLYTQPTILSRTEYQTVCNNGFCYPQPVVIYYNGSTLPINIFYINSNKQFSFNFTDMIPVFENNKIDNYHNLFFYSHDEFYWNSRTNPYHNDMYHPSYDINKFFSYTIPYKTCPTPDYDFNFCDLNDYLFTTFPQLFMESTNEITGFFFNNIIAITPTANQQAFNGKFTPLSWSLNYNLNHNNIKNLTENIKDLFFYLPYHINYTETFNKQEIFKSYITGSCSSYYNISYNNPDLTSDCLWCKPFSDNSTLSNLNGNLFFDNNKNFQVIKSVMFNNNDTLILSSNITLYSLNNLIFNFTNNNQETINSILHRIPKADLWDNSILGNKIGNYSIAIMKDQNLSSLFIFHKEIQEFNNKNQSLKEDQNNYRDFPEALYDLNIFNNYLYNINYNTNTKKFVQTHTNHLTNQILYKPIINLYNAINNTNNLWDSLEFIGDQMIGCKNWLLNQCFILNYHGLPSNISLYKFNELPLNNIKNNNSFNLFDFNIKSQWILEDLKNNTYYCDLQIIEYDGNKNSCLLCSYNPYHQSNNIFFAYDFIHKKIFYPTKAQDNFWIINNFYNQEIYIHQSSLNGFWASYNKNIPSKLLKYYNKINFFTHNNNLLLKINNIISYSYTHDIFIHDTKFTFYYNVHNKVVENPLIMGNGTSGLIKICTKDLLNNLFCVDGSINQYLIYYNQNYNNYPINFNNISIKKTISFSVWKKKYNNFLQGIIDNNIYKIITSDIHLGFTINNFYNKNIICDTIIDNYYENLNLNFPLFKYCNFNNQTLFIELLLNPQWNSKTSTLEPVISPWFLCKQIDNEWCNFFLFNHTEILCNLNNCFNNNITLNNNFIDRLIDNTLLMIINKYNIFNTNQLIMIYPIEQTLPTPWMNNMIYKTLTIAYSLEFINNYNNSLFMRYIITTSCILYVILLSLLYYYCGYTKENEQKIIKPYFYLYLFTLGFYSWPLYSIITAMINDEYEIFIGNDENFIHNSKDESTILIDLIINVILCFFQLGISIILLCKHKWPRLKKAICHKNKMMVFNMYILSFSIFQYLHTILQINYQPSNFVDEIIT